MAPEYHIWYSILDIWQQTHLLSSLNYSVDQFLPPKKLHGPTSCKVITPVGDTVGVHCSKLHSTIPRPPLHPSSLRTWQWVYLPLCVCKKSANLYHKVTATDGNVIILFPPFVNRLLYTVPGLWDGSLLQYIAESAGSRDRIWHFIRCIDN